MRKLILLASLACLLAAGTQAHNIDYAHVILRHWSVTGVSNNLEGSFLMCKDGQVFIEDKGH